MIQNKKKFSLESLNGVFMLSILYLLPTIYPVFRVCIWIFFQNTDPDPQMSWIYSTGRSNLNPCPDPQHLLLVTKLDLKKYDVPALLMDDIGTGMWSTLFACYVGFGSYEGSASAPCVPVQTRSKSTAPLQVTK